MNNTTSQKAVVATVELGNFSFEGLMLPDGSYAIAVPQVARLVLFNQNTASRDLKRLLGENFRPSKISTELGNQKVNVIALKDFDRLLFELALSGNEKAIEISRQLVGLSLRQLFADAFGEKFEEEERQDWLIKRQATKVTFRDMTDSLKEWGFADGKDYGKFVAILQGKLGIPSGTRDIQDLETLNKLELAQAKLATYIECGKTPWEALFSLKV